MNIFTGLFGNSYLKYGLIFVGGIVAGMVLSGALRRGKTEFVPVVVKSDADK